MNVDLRGGDRRPTDDLLDDGGRAREQRFKVGRRESSAQPDEQPDASRRASVELDEVISAS